MTSYGYGGGYSTTNYSAQGGADGGGFVNNGYGGSQPGSQDSPGSSKAYGKDSLRPVTIKQLIDATQPHPDSQFKVDGSEVGQVTFIGEVNKILKQATNHTYQLDDGTGLIDVKLWIDGEAAVEDTKTPAPKEGDYLRVWGRLKAFNNKRHVAAHIIRPIAEFNEIQYHLLEATAVHLFFTRGPVESLTAGNADSGNGMFVDGPAGANQAPTGGKKLPKISPTAAKVYSVLQAAPENNEGMHVHHIASALGIPVIEVFKAGDELLAEGAIFTTLDDETWAALVY